MKIATSAVSVSPSPPQEHTLTHTNNNKKKNRQEWKREEKGEEELNKIKEVLQSQKHSALPRRAFVCTNIFFKKKEQKMRALYKHRKKEANIYNLFLVSAGVAIYTLNYTFYK